MTPLKAVKCPACGARMQIAPTAQAWHYTCPNRKQKSNPPKYQEVSK